MRLVDDFLDQIAGRLALLTRTACRLQDRLDDIDDETIDDEITERLVELNGDIERLKEKFDVFMNRHNIGTKAGTG